MGPHEESLNSTQLLWDICGHSKTDDKIYFESEGRVSHRGLGELTIHIYREAGSSREGLRNIYGLLNEGDRSLVASLINQDFTLYLSPEFYLIIE